ncbi:NACHT domain-containing protein [Nodularia spumigena]|uniref:NACHT domain-containing protein n=1 Tax=Nodularia spumigena TaxID=70799 RepID=UPI002B208EFA|nr:pentapeptide repeat-containing protein [Nodularia spumigena]MEA5524987.1 pentapeptide repeat-containing protein [Nodularia spumigena UHCC 0143]
MVKIKQTWQGVISGLFGNLGQHGDTVEFGAEATKAGLEFASVLGILANPSAPVLIAGLSFVGLARKGLDLLHETTKQEFNVKEWVAVAFPLAYLQSFDALVQRNVWLKQKIDAEKSEQGAKQQIDQLGEFELDENLADEALKNFSESRLGQSLNRQLSHYLEQAGIDKNITPIITGWVAWETYPNVESLFSHEPENVRQALNMKMTAAKEIRDNHKYADIESYLQEYISPKPNDPVLRDRWKVIDEEFTFPDIYVSLEANLLDSNGKLQKKVDAVNLETWAKDYLTNPDPNKKPQVMFIQAGPGRGKSVFCRMFANWVRENLHPIWTPILIRLRDIDTFEPNIENTLRAAVRQNFSTSDSWLNDPNTRFLFLLDGFDELRFEGRTAKGVEDFLQQVGNYQAQTGCKHRFLVTGRESALQGLENRVPTNLQRVEIALMNDKLQEQWLEKWSKLVQQDKVEAFQKFLTAKSCPERVKKLAREPLLLYLLAAMHRDDKLNTEMFKDSSGAQAKILIYQTTMDWVLTKQRPQELNDTITEFDTEDLRLILIEAGLSVTQSGREWTSIKTIEERLKNDKSVKNMLEKAQQNLGENPLRNALAAFYLRPAKASDSTEGAVEFIHKSFGEFLCAQKFKESLQKWVGLYPGNRRDKFLIDDDRLSKEIYELLGYGGLTSEIVEYLMTLLEAEENFQYIKLFERLEYFYLDWCQGKFISGHPNNLPLNQMQTFQAQNISLDLREVDIYAGLNVMILLLEVHRYAQTKNELKDQIVFYPCGKKDYDNFDGQRLLRIISYSNSVIVDTFLKTVYYFLSGANLEGANLSRAILVGANLSRTILTGANLPGAILLYANLAGANFKGANLEGANLEGANLAGANLAGANLSRAILADANLEGAILAGANLEGAILSGADLNQIIWDDNRIWNDVQGLDSAFNVPDGLLS